MSSWDATGRVAPVWAKVGGRDALAYATGIGGTTLSSYNSGKRALGIANARRIAAAVTGVTLADLGAPASAAEPAVRLIDARLQELGDAVSDLLANQTRILLQLEELTRFQTRLEQLEARLAEREADPKGQPRRRRGA